MTNTQYTYIYMGILHIHSTDNHYIITSYSPNHQNRSNALQCNSKTQRREQWLSRVLDWMEGLLVRDSLESLYCVLEQGITVKAETLIFISGHCSAISSAQEGKSGSICLVKS